MQLGSHATSYPRLKRNRTEVLSDYENRIPLLQVTSLWIGGSSHVYGCVCERKLAQTWNRDTLAHPDVLGDVLSNGAPDCLCFISITELPLRWFEVAIAAPEQLALTREGLGALSVGCSWSMDFCPELGDSWRPKRLALVKRLEAIGADSCLIFHSIILKFK